MVCSNSSQFSRGAPLVPQLTTRRPLTSGRLQMATSFPTAVIHYHARNQSTAMCFAPIVTPTVEPSRMTINSLRESIGICFQHFWRGIQRLCPTVGRASTLHRSLRHPSLHVLAPCGSCPFANLHVAQNSNGFQHSVPCTLSAKIYGKRC